MKRVAAKSISMLSATLAPAVLVLFIVPLSISGQSPNRNTPNAPPGVSKLPSGKTQPSIRERQLKMLEIEREAKKPVMVERDNLALVQIAEDFEKIQLINNKMMSVTMPAAEPNYAIIADTTAEIRTRASRLKQNLGLAKLDTKEAAKGRLKRPLDADGIKAELLSLDSSIMSFVKNPIFKTLSVVNVEQAEKAGSDLEDIIKLSQLISKDAERLKNSSSKSRL